MNNRIVVIGSSNVDFIMKMDHLPAVGETVTDAVFVQTYGGKGANQAVSAARAGGDVWLVNCVGDDPFAALVRENLRQAGVHVEYVFEEAGIASGAALVMIGGAGRNYLSVAPGANYRLTPAMLQPLKPLIQSAALVMVQYEVLPETLLSAIDLAVEAGKPVLFNLAPARPLAGDALAKVDTLVVNEVEAQSLCGFAIEGPEEAARAAAALLARGCRNAIVTLGVEGAYVAAPGLRAHVPAFPVEAVDTTAAGDVFCGSLAVALVEGRPLLEAVHFASAASAICVTRLGAQPSAPDRAEIDAFLAAHRAGR